MACICQLVDASIHPFFSLCLTKSSSTPFGMSLHCFHNHISCNRRILRSYCKANCLGVCVCVRVSLQNLGGRGPSFLGFWCGTGCLATASEFGWQKALFPGILGRSSGLHGLPTLNLGGIGLLLHGDLGGIVLSGSLRLRNLAGRGPSLWEFWGGTGCLRGKSSRIWVAEGPHSWNSGTEFWVSWFAYSELGQYGPLFLRDLGGAMACLWV